MNAHENPGRNNISRFFVRHPSVGWALLAATLVWGALSYVAMPKRKDPYFKIRKAVAVAVWPGASPLDIEKLVLEPIEAKLATASSVATIESSARTGAGIVLISLREDLSFDAVDKAFDDVELKLSSVQLPRGAQPVQLEKDFGDTNILLYSVGSPKARDTELDVRAIAIRAALAALPEGAWRSAAIVPFPLREDAGAMRGVAAGIAASLAQGGDAPEVRVGPGFALAASKADASAARAAIDGLLVQRGATDLLHPDAWRAFVHVPAGDVRAELGSVRGDAYTLGELDRFAELLQRRVRGTPGVAKVIRSGTVGERVFLEFDRAELSQSGIRLDDVARALDGGDPSVARASSHVGARAVSVDTRGVFRDEAELGDTVISRTAAGAPVHLSERFDVVRGYEDPRRTAHTLTVRDESGRFVRSKAVTIGVQQLPDAQIADVGARVQRAVNEVRRTLPEDLRIANITDQPKQVEDKIGSFVRSLIEAILIVVVVGFLGFWEWRSATVLALSVPVTLALTFGLMHLFGLDIQQISLAALIISLGLLVDDPVVANDAIRAELDRGERRSVAAWLGPTKLATAILFATLTNIAAYLPFLLLTGDVGRYIFALPIVLTISLVASRIVSMTFIPLFGYALLRRSGGEQGTQEEGAIIRGYRKLIGWALGRRKLVLILACVSLGLFSLGFAHLRLLFFPKDLMFQAYVDVFLPEDATVEATEATLAQAEAVLAECDDELASRPERHGKRALARMASWAGQSAPRFWYSLSPKEGFPNYGQIVLEMEDPHDTELFAALAQERLSRAVPGAYVDVKALENGPPVTYPMELRISGENAVELRRIAEALITRIRALPEARRVRDDWGTDALRLELDADRGELDGSGLTPGDLSRATFAAFEGVPVGAMLGDRRIPVALRERRADKRSASDLPELVLPSPQTGSWMPAVGVAQVAVELAPARIARRDQIRTMTVLAFPAPGVLPSELMRKVYPILREVRADLSPGYAIGVGGAEEKTLAVLLDSAVVALTSVLAIYFMLLLQFRSAKKPLVVLAAIPFGVAAAVSSVVGMGAPFGFTAILGTISLIGVIVSHVIVLFDGIEHGEQQGLSLREALVTAGAQRLRPVAITVGATVLGLVPLAAHGGPLWEPLCYAQIGGLTVATLVTLVLVPVLYAVFVEDMGFLHWGPIAHEDDEPLAPPPSVSPLEAAGQQT
jgi:multidrug efflux pump subunit AcrB